MEGAKKWGREAGHWAKRAQEIKAEIAAAAERAAARVAAPVAVA